MDSVKISITFLKSLVGQPAINVSGAEFNSHGCSSIDGVISIETAKSLLVDLQKAITEAETAKRTEEEEN